MILRLADVIEQLKAERRRQGYKPRSLYDKRAFERRLLSSDQREENDNEQAN